jgi:hypothetical protein
METYSNYRLAIILPEDAEHPDNTELDIIDDLRERNENALYALNEDGSTRDEAHWHDALSDLQEFSQQYPKVIFVLTAESGEPEDFGYGLIETKVMNGVFLE